MIAPRFFSVALLTMIMSYSLAQYKPLYKGRIPNFIDAPSQESDSRNGHIYFISAVAVPGYSFYSAGDAGDTKPCVIICPGGGYGGLAIEHEGTDVARFFNAIGVHAFVLKYRVPSDAHQVDKKIAPLQDLQQAIYLIRKNARRWHIDPSRVGVMGFSAGGHLASSLAVHYDDPKLKLKQSISIRPDFQILIYPVISFGKYTHQGSRLNLLGEGSSDKLIQYFSNELHVNANTPKAFLVHAQDDEAVPIENALQYHAALQSHGVVSELFSYEKGGHGFGLMNRTSDVKWTDALTSWLKLNNIIR
ncbi:MAG: alpha/beta hydrolase [bacterium]|jgi:acetyl esterase/lipase